MNPIDHKTTSCWRECNLGDLIEVEFNLDLKINPNTGEPVEYISLPDKMEGYFRGLVRDESDRLHFLLSKEKDQAATQYLAVRIYGYHIIKKSLFPRWLSAN